LPELKEIVREKLFFPQQITINEFKRQIGAENGDEPEAKKSRIVSNGKEEESQQADAKLWEGNYVLCESQLPNAHSALFVCHFPIFHVKRETSFAFFRFHQI
jgi:hypothetical protein